METSKRLSQVSVLVDKTMKETTRNDFLGSPPYYLDQVHK